MSAPEIRIVAGSPTPEEEAAVRAAILRIWRDDQTEAARADAPRAWTLSGRAPANDVVPRSPDAWKLSGRVGGR